MTETMTLSGSRPAPVADISDAALMARLAGGDSSALGTLYQRYARMVGSLLLRLDPERGPASADDLVQEVFLTLLETAPRYREEGRLRSWICGIAVRKSRSTRRTLWRRRLLGARSPGTAAAGVAGPPSSFDGRVEAHDRVSRALDRLRPGAREALILIAVEGFSAAQAGEVLGISEGAAAVRVHRARAAMVAALADLDRKPEETR